MKRTTMYKTRKLYFGELRLQAIAQGKEMCRQLQRHRVIWLSIFAALALCSVSVIVNYPTFRTCTIFTIAHNGTVLFGNNEDWHSPDLLLGFNPSSPAGYGSVHVGFRHSDGGIEFGGAMNDHGLAWDVNGLPEAQLTPHPERRYSHATDNYLSTITKKAATVAEAIEIAQDFDFGDSLSLQIHIADASGDAAVLSAGPDSEVVFTRKPAGDGYLVSTNFNLANPDNGTIGWRYDTAVSMLEALDDSQELTIQYAGDILDAVHLKTLTSYTMYSNIFDLVNNKLYLYYMAEYGERIELDVAEELAKGQRIIEMRELFSPDTATAGDAAYRQFETRFRIVQVAVIAAALALIAVLVVFVMRKLRADKRSTVP